MIGFGNVPLPREVVDGTATPLTTTFTDSVVLLAAPTSVGVNVGGRVTVVTITDGNGIIRRSLSNPLGYYTFDNVLVGQTYVISAQHKKYQFAQPSIVVTVNNELTNADFVALE